MSFDILVIKPTDPDMNDLTAVDTVDDLGTQAWVNEVLQRIFPGCLEGACVVGEAYALEALCSGEPVTSVHLTLRWGTAWSDTAYALFLQHLHTLCLALAASAFAASDNSRIAFTP